MASCSQATSNTEMIREVSLLITVTEGSRDTTRVMATIRKTFRLDTYVLNLLGSYLEIYTTRMLHFPIR